MAIEYGILVLSTLMASGKALFCKVIGTGERPKRERMALNFQSFLVAFVCALCFVLSRLPELFTISSFSLFLSIAFGLSVALTQLMQSKAMGMGPSALVTFIYTCGFTVPLIYGMVFWQENWSVFQAVGVVLLIASLVLAMEKSSEKKSGFGWFVFAVIAMLGSGANAILQKTHQRSAFAEELPFFLVLALFFSAVFTGIATLLMPKETKKQETEKPRTLLQKIGPSIGLGVCVGSLNFLNLHLAGKLPSVILFPIYNVGSMLLTTVISSFLYKEKLTKKQTISFFIGIAAIIMIGLL